MSKREISKLVQATICEFCDTEIDTKVDGYCYHYMKSSDGTTINHHKYNVIHIVFSWLKPKENKVRGDWILYDFHASCFDKLMIKFLEEKGKS